LTAPPLRTDPPQYKAPGHQEFALFDFLLDSRFELGFGDFFAEAF
jgi:hypothetical protein